MDMHEAFENLRGTIAAQVNSAAKESGRTAEVAQVPAEHLPADELFSICTHMKVHESGALSLFQPAGMVTLTPSQQAELMNRIAVLVLREQARALLS